MPHSVRPICRKTKSDVALRKDPQTINTSLAGFLFIVPIERNEDGNKGIAHSLA